jgi:hypothetical protein
VAENDSASERRALVELYGKSLEGFDRTIVTVSAGSLALSITFLKDIAAHPTPGSTSSLLAGWTSLILSLGLIVVSMLSGQQALEAALAERNDAERLTSRTTWLNVSSMVFLLIGFAGLANFARLNLSDAGGVATAATTSPASPSAPTCSAVCICGPLASSAPLLSSTQQAPLALPMAPPAASTSP